MEYRKYILKPIEEEWFLIMETEKHGLFFNKELNKFRRYRYNDYHEYDPNRHWKKYRSKLKPTMEFEEIDSQKITQMKNMIVETINGEKTKVFYIDKVDNNEIVLISRISIGNNIDNLKPEISLIKIENIKDANIIRNMILLESI